MPTPPHTSDDMRSLPTLRQSLRTFASSPHTFQILRTIPYPSPKLSSPLKTLYILDSSFNPPTLAHLRICTSAILSDKPTAVPKRLLLLLATQNADKAPKPAAFEQRLAMMSLFAEELINRVTGSDEGKHKEGDVIVDVGVTKEARFIDKAKVLEQQEEYSDPGPVEQVHLTGYDTLIRLLDTNYYPPDHTLKPLEGLLEKHRVRVTRRTDDAWGGREEQDGYLRRIAEGETEADGGRREWAQRIELVEGRTEGEEIISSTKVRKAAKGKDEQALSKLVTDAVASWILEKNLYLEED
ncbi:hypothetical protein N7G274_006115 [Stereocaulon virgatum]|uniref:Nicotinamide-nucleotide adenylyltransferase n=1 Tax=Stereocaulon virgatum TaxID=373712 RepID=A0ABR4A714_9LECA